MESFKYLYVCCNTEEKEKNGVEPINVFPGEFAGIEDFMSYCETAHGDEEDPVIIFSDIPDPLRPFFLKRRVRSVLWDMLLQIVKYRVNEKALYAYMLLGVSDVTNVHRFLDDLWDDLYSEERYEDLQDFAEKYIREEYNIPEEAVEFFDMEGFERELSNKFVMMHGYVFKKRQT